MPRFAATAGNEIYFNDWGTGTPLVFIHGGALNADIWEYQTVPLSEQGFRCISYDQRGCGRSDAPGDGYSFDDLAADLHDLVSHLQLDRFVLIAHSMASGTVTRYLNHHSSIPVSKVVLICPTTPMMALTENNPDGIPGTVFEQSLELLAVNRPLWIEIAAPAFFGGDATFEGFPHQIVEWGKRIAEQASGKGTRGLFGSFWSEDFRNEMTAFTMPTLILHGEHDASAPLDLCGRRTAAAIHASTLKVYPGGSHGIFLSHAAEVNADIAKFVAA